MIRKSIVIAFCCLYGLGAAAQKNFTVKMIRVADMDFPVFYSETDSVIAQKINITLQLGELELLKGREKTNLFEQITENNGGLYGAKTNINSTIHVNNDRLLSLELEEAADGMTTHYWTRFYNFNVYNGDQVTLTDIFTPAGFKTFTQMVARKRRHDFVRDSIAGEVTADVYENNTSCFTELDEEDFGISHDSLFVDGANCLPKAYMFNAPVLRHTFSFKQLKPLLNDYGIALFTPSTNMSRFQSFHHPQLMKGTINDKYNIYFLMRNDGTDSEGNGYISGIYAYEKKGVGIPLSGTIKDGRLELTEVDKTGDDRAIINATVTKDEIIGTWTDKKQNHTYTFHVKKW